MAFGGLLEGFLAEKSYDEPRRGRHVRMEMNQRRSLTGPESDKLTLKKLSTVSSPYPKYSWPMMVSRESEGVKLARDLSNQTLWSPNKESPKFTVGPHSYK
ncbi:hypothetical protein RB195_017143 [Necator americanus]|uniref:Uncharacterized protein n=1 Tax=Necator americanus TaxID=51031 RepID=A0ABR1C3T7_NECAM